MKFLSAALALILAAVAVLGYFTLFIVHQTEQAMVLQFGQLVRIINADPDKNEAGLYFRMPFVQDVVYYDKRVLDLDAEPKEVVMAKNVPLIVDAFARYRIINPLLFYQSVRTIGGASVRLEPILTSTVRTVLGGSTYMEVVRDKREQMMREMLTQMNAKSKIIGVEFIDVRIKRADLPADNSKKVFERMISERERVAQKIRSEGTAQSEIIRADADKKVVEMKAEALRQALILRGEGDAERTKLLADSFGKDADFFAFYRSMQAYEAGLKTGETRMLLSPNSEFFRYFNESAGR